MPPRVAAKPAAKPAAKKGGYEELKDEEPLPAEAPLAPAAAPSPAAEVVLDITEDAPVPLTALEVSTEKMTRGAPAYIDSSGQFKLVWTEPLTADGETVEPGELNLYIFPGGFSGGKLNAIRNVVLHLARTNIAVFEAPDPVGAYIIHALVVCNTPPSLELAFDVLKIAPHLLLQTHFGQPFSGENCLHIVCVNRRPDIGIRFIDIVVANFDDAKAKKFLKIGRASCRERV